MVVVVVATGPACRVRAIEIAVGILVAIAVEKEVSVPSTEFLPAMVRWMVLTLLLRLALAV
jgi:hypothetical protein